MRSLESEVDKPNSWRRYSNEQKTAAIKSEYVSGISASALAIKVGKVLSKSSDLKITRMAIIAFYHRNDHLRESHPLNVKTKEEIAKTKSISKPKLQPKVIATCWADFSVKHKLTLFKEVYRTGFTLQNIADALATRLNDGTISRNAIQGFYGRNKKDLIGWVSFDGANTESNPYEFKAPDDFVQFDADAPRVSMSEHDSKIHCSFIFSDKSYCAHPKQDGRKNHYCSHHHSRIYQPRSERITTKVIYR